MITMTVVFIAVLVHCRWAINQIRKEVSPLQ